MSTENSELIRNSILEVVEASLEAQLRAVRRLKGGSKNPPPAKKSMSQVEMAFNILNESNTPLHINEIIKRIEAVYHTSVDRESLVSALTKKIQRDERFFRTGKNTFEVRG